MLPLVLTAAGLSPTSAALALTLLLPVDWLLARFRSALNVTSDLVVAVLLDAGSPAPAPGEEASAPAFQ
jgi:Na+/H+-dicarboxylate symporter